MMKIKNSDIKFTVTQGIVHVNSITVLQLTEHVLLFNVDFKNKYPTFIYSDGGVTFEFGADEHTQDVINRAAPLTNVEVIGLKKAWCIRKRVRLYTTVEMGRYYANFCIVKGGRRRMSWWNKS